MNAKHAALLALFLSALFVVPTVVAVPPANTPSGYYSDLTNYRKMLYNNLTNTLTYVGQAASDGVDISSGGIARNGNCTYIDGIIGEDPNITWENTLAEYSYGRCANVDVRDVDNILVRADVAVTSGSSDWWGTQSYALFMASGSSTPLGRHNISLLTSCGNNPVSWCDGRPASTYTDAEADKVPGAEIICVYTEVYKSHDLNDPSARAYSCQTL